MADAAAQADRAYDQVVEWLEHFEALDDPRQSGKVAYPLSEMLLQCLLAVLAGADGLLTFGCAMSSCSWPSCWIPTRAA